MSKKFSKRTSEDVGDEATILEEWWRLALPLPLLLFLPRLLLLPLLLLLRPAQS